MASKEATLFPNYQEIPRRISVQNWQRIRVLCMLGAFSYALALLFYEPLLFITWGIIVPLLPLLFFFAPGIWRNACPLAAVNQVPRLLGWAKGWALPDWARTYAYVIGIGLFFTLVSLRKVLFNTSSVATGGLILGALFFAFFGGIIFKGKSGWCSTFCPLLPVQHIYGQSPFLLVPNSHCQPCVGCVKNCYDFNPKAAYLADLYDNDRRYAGFRRFFASAFPGFVLGYFLIPSPPLISIFLMYLSLIICVLLSVGVFSLLEAFLKVSPVKLTGLFGAAAINFYYWFSFSSLATNLQSVIGAQAVFVLAWILKLILLGSSLVWLMRLSKNEKAYVKLAAESPATVVSKSTLKILQRKSAEKNKVEVEFNRNGQHILSQANSTLLDLAKGAGLNIEEGCRVGMCGADPVTVTGGMENLSPMSDEEKSTLQRLGLGPRCRLACSARVLGNVQVSLGPEYSKKELRQLPDASSYDASIKNIVVVGNGIAGITAAEYARRLHPECKITVVGDERYGFYNRIAVTQLIFGRKGMKDLFLLPETWCDEFNIHCWINTRVAGIRPQEKRVIVEKNEALEYDRLILAMGSRSHLPEYYQADLQGVFVVRHADDAMAIREYIQEKKVSQAVVIGAGALGLETGFAMSKVGLKVCILEKSPWIMHRQLDQQAADVLASYLIGLGITLVTQTQVEKIQSDGKEIKGIKLKDGRKIDCEIVVICAGVDPDVSLAKEAGLDVNRGIIVDQSMRTSVPDIFAAGDVAEYQGKPTGLWSTAVEQGRVAALSALGKEAHYEGDIDIVILKIAGIDVVSIGDINRGEPGVEEVVHAEISSSKYAKVFIKNNVLVSAILIGHPDYFPIIARLIKNKTDIARHLPKLREHGWQALRDT